MTNLAYGLLVRDMSSGFDRERLDEALSGKLVLRPDEVPALQPAPDTVPALPNASSMEELREMWGRSPDAIRSKLQFDESMKKLPRQ